MELSIHSKNRLLKTFEHWAVPRDFADPMFNYLVYGYEPGGCFTAVLANDFISAVRRSHPSNTIEAFKALAGWIMEYCPKEAYGSYANVEAWCDMTSAMRRPILEKKRIIYIEKQETWLTLKEGPVREVVLY